MKTTIYLFVSILFFASCKKDKTPTPTPPVEHRVKTQTDVTVSGGPSSTTNRSYEYGADGRITKASNLTNGEKTEYTYTATTVTEKYYFSSGTLVGTATYELNSKGFVTRTTSSFGSTLTYEYNSNNFLTKYIVTGGTTTSTGLYYYNASQMLDSVVDTYSSGGTNYRSVFSYDQYQNGKVYTIGDRQFGQTWVGHTFTAPYGRSKYTNGINPTETETNTYEYDGQGRINKKISVTSGGFSPTTTTTSTYTYY
jgi:hypothetical protein